MADLNLNFNFVSSAQTLNAKPAEVNAIGEDFARMIVNEVALAASKDSFQRARTRFVSSVKTAIHAEVSRMALLIGRFLPLPAKYTGPHGQMSLREMSATATKFDFPTTFKRESTQIEWAKRSKKYLRWKQLHSLPTNWWEAHGDLRKSLSEKGADFYEETFGPIRVRLERPAAGRDEKGRFSRNNPLPKSAVNPSRPEAGSLQGRINVTAPSSRGRVSAEVSVGTLKVDVFGKITPAMLPGLAHPRWAPQQADPTPGLGLVGLFPNDGKGGTRNKLLGVNIGGRAGGKGRQHYRYAIEPFVSFYLMRAIPNAVWRRTESLIRGNVEAKATSKSGLSNQFDV